MCICAKEYISSLSIDLSIYFLQCSIIKLSKYGWKTKKNRERHSIHIGLLTNIIIQKGNVNFQHIFTDAYV